MIRVRVPATTSNLGPGFDALGLALRVYNTLDLDAAETPRIEIEGEGAGSLPRDASHLAYRAALAVVESVAAHGAGGHGRRHEPWRGQAARGPHGGTLPRAFHLRQHNRIPLARGLGSSAAAIVGGAAAANALLGGPLDRAALIDLAAGMEGHPDNVAPAVLGGLVACAAGETGTIRTVRLMPRQLHVIIAIPEFAVSTAEARRLLPQAVPFGDAVFNVARTALLVAALIDGRMDLLDEATRDRLHQPYRAKLVPGLEAVFAAARHAGAHGVALSGSGPTVVAFGEAPGIAEAMRQAFEHAGARCRAIEAEIDTDGAAVEPVS
ncbi:MAG TPA: homoserine kinase [bacterium]|nr:homoserine kinase [bacterium]